MTNKEILQKKINNLEGNFALGCYNNDIEKLSKIELMKVINNIDQEYTDVDVKIKRKDYVIEITTVDQEKDLNILTRGEYIKRYGNEKYLDN